MWSERNIVFDNNICRFCGSISKKLFRIPNDHVSVESSEGNAIWQLIRRLVPLKIESGDQKPQQVCDNCIATLEKYDAFISTCISNDVAFDNILQSVKSDEIVNSSSVKNITWPQDGKLRVETNQNDGVILLNKVNANPNVMTENVYIIVELNCKGLNMEPDPLKCNENDKNVLSLEKISEEVEKNDIPRGEPVTESCLNDRARSEEKKSKPFSCTICNKSLRRKSNLISHLALHSKDRPHKCNECGKNFAVHADLTLHKNIHTKSYACNICEKCFVTKSKLERHEKSHTGVKEHACPICKKPFAEKNNMIAHISVHTGERPFICSICKKSFRTQSHLTDHNKVHSAESPFKCNICNKSFKWKSNLKDHNKFHSGEKFRCTNCYLEFSIRTDYYKHRKECRMAISQMQINILEPMNEIIQSSSQL